jgi:EAL domain-containing protein (putative c-di-GMP-specific phosphodiesterase class I)
MAVNLSAHQFRHPRLAEDVARVLANTGLDPAGLEVEITESTAMGNADATIATLERLKGIGVQLAIDDFGTGYSSLGYLQRFPIDVLKVDRSFVGGLPANRGDAAIVQAVIALARALHLKVVAEGVETSEQLSELKILGCDLGQGYYFGKPVSTEEAEALLGQAAALAGGAKG